jgi:hypothetical protein
VTGNLHPRAGRLLLVLTGIFILAAASAQQPQRTVRQPDLSPRSLWITVRDRQGHPIPGAVALAGNVPTDPSGKDGVLRIDWRPDTRFPVVVEVRVAGFKSRSELIDNATRTTLEVTLEPTETRPGGTSVSLEELSGERQAGGRQLREEVRRALDRGDNARAEALLLGLAARNPSDPDAFNQLGMAVLRQGRMEQASLWFEKAYGLSGARTFPAANLGMIRWFQNRRDESYRFLEEAIGHGFSSPSAHYTFGLLSLERGRWRQGAEQLAQSSPERFPYRDLFLSVALGAGGHRRQAAKSLREFLKRRPVGLVTSSYPKPASESSERRPERSPLLETPATR